jgi:hypothetical protein
MLTRKYLSSQDIARSNVLWNDEKRLVNLIVSAILLVVLLGAIAYL